MRREYNKNRKSTKYFLLSRLYQEKLIKAKQSYKRKIIDDIKTANSGQWYSKLKRISRYDQTKSEVIQVEEISNLDDKLQAEEIADKLSEISNTYKGVEMKDILIPFFSQQDIPQLSTSQIRKYILRIKTNKSCPPRDIPPKLIKEFSEFFFCTSKGYYQF